MEIRCSFYGCLLLPHLKTNHSHTKRRRTVHKGTNWRLLQRQQNRWMHYCCPPQGTCCEIVATNLIAQQQKLTFCNQRNTQAKRPQSKICKGSHHSKAATRRRTFCDCLLLLPCPQTKNLHRIRCYAVQQANNLTPT